MVGLWRMDHHPSRVSRDGSSDPLGPYCTAMFLATPIFDQKVPRSSWLPLVRFAVNLPCVFKPSIDTFLKALPDTAAGNSLANVVMSSATYSKRGARLSCGCAESSRLVCRLACDARLRHGRVRGWWHPTFPTR